MEPVYVPTNPHEKAMQRALIQYRNPKNYDLVEEALRKAGRTDLIGFDKRCLIRPRTGTKTEWQGADVVRKEKHRGGYETGRIRPDRNSQDGKQEKQGTRQKKRTIRNVHKKKQK